MRTASGSCVRGENRKHAFRKLLFGHGGGHGDASSTQRLGKLGCEGNLQVEGGKCINIDKHFLRRADARHFPLIEHDDAVGEGCLLHEVGDHDDGHALIVERANDAHEPFAAAGVEHCGCLVQDEDLRVHRKGAGDGDALLLSAGKCMCLMFLEARKTDVLETLGHAFAQLSGGYSQILGAEGNVVFHKRGDQLVIGVLKYHAGALTNLPELRFILRIFSVYIQRAFCWQKNCIDVLCKRRFSRAIVPQNRNKIALLHIKIDLIDRTDCFLLFSVLINPEIVIGQLSAFYDIHLNFYPFPCNSM